VAAAGLLVGSASSASAQEAAAVRQEIDQLRRDFETLKQQYGDRLTALESKLAAVEGAAPGQPPATPPAAAQPPVSQPPAAPPAAEVPSGAAGAGGPTGALPAYGSTVGGAKVFNPDIAVIGDFLGAAGHNSVNPQPAFEMHESEASFQAVVDPYARADFFLSFGETGVELEEGYATLTALPGGLLTKVGKMRAAFGKVNTMHNHVLPWTDRPLVTLNLVGGEDGIDDAGISISRFLPAPKNWFIQGTAQVFRGDSSDLYSAQRREDLSVVGHLRAYRDLSESTNLDLGVSYSRGHNDAGTVANNVLFDPDHFLTNLYGVDATLRWKPLRRAIYKNFLFRTELFWSARDQLSTLNAFQTQHAFGTYASAEYRVNRRWTVGGRFDRSGHANNANLTDTGFSAILTYWPSEFSQIRGQYRFGHLALANPGDFSNANELLFQFLFVMGAHGAHPF
jgi:hypothetical protein